MLHGADRRLVYCFLLFRGRGDFDGLSVSLYLNLSFRSAARMWGMTDMRRRQSGLCCCPSLGWKSWRESCSRSCTSFTWLHKSVTRASLWGWENRLWCFYIYILKGVHISLFGCNTKFVYWKHGAIYYTTVPDTVLHILVHSPREEFTDTCHWNILNQRPSGHFWIVNLTWLTLCQVSHELINRRI